MKATLIKEPPYRKVKISPKYEEKAWKILFDAGVPFDRASENEFVITSGQCQLLNRNKVPYQKLD